MKTLKESSRVVVLGRILGTVKRSDSGSYLVTWYEGLVRYQQWFPARDVEPGIWHEWEDVPVVETVAA